MRQLTRQELYDLVWAKPMTKVAAEFGISDVGLHKICKKHRIPKPGLGYWAKVAAGRYTRQVRLFDCTDEALNIIRISPGPIRRLPENGLTRLFQLPLQKLSLEDCDEPLMNFPRCKLSESLTTMLRINI